MIYFIMFQYSLFFFIKLKSIYKFKGLYSPLTQTTDNINYKKIILIHTQTIALYSLKYISSKIATYAYQQTYNSFHTVIFIHIIQGLIEKSVPVH